MRFALREIVENIFPGRWSDTRLPNEKELKAIIIYLCLSEKRRRKCASARRLMQRELPVGFWDGLIPPDYVLNYCEK